ncbi:unnamed protein product [Rotaria sordida]|uniref:Uncharacterized protein n=1 Tax=Rotaria sordida TaxID=392033 RepID=A0A819HYS7_9BILA|nr:unnamed protein product [Rotaria sordida]CAF3907903.1 unnamed protein product [Rotaria sordida]
MYPPPRPRAYPRRGVRFIRRAPAPGAVGIPLGAGAGAGGIGGLIGGLALPLLCLGCLASLALLGLFATMIGATAYMNAIQRQVRRNVQGADLSPALSEKCTDHGKPVLRPVARPVAVVASGGGKGGGAGALGGILGGVGGLVTCLCCLSAIGLLGLWATFIPFVAFFKYAWDQETRAYGGSPSIQNLQQIVILLAICLLTIRFVKRQMNT